MNRSKVWMALAIVGVLLVGSSKMSIAKEGLSPRTLVVYQEIESPYPSYRKVISGINQITIKRWLAKHYTKINYFDSDDRGGLITAVETAEKLQKPNAKVDIMIIAPNAAVESFVSSYHGHLGRSHSIIAISRDSGKLSERVRLLGITEKYYGLPGQGAEPAMFLPRFVRQLSQNFSQPEVAYSHALGLTEWDTKTIDPYLNVDHATQDPGPYKFQDVFVRMMGAFLPGVDLQFRQDDTAMSFLSVAGDVAWTTLQERFGYPSEGNRMVLDQESVNLLAKSIASQNKGDHMGNVFKEVEDNLEGIEIEKTKKGFILHVHFKKPLSLSLLAPGEPKKAFRPFRLVINKEVRFNVRTLEKNPDVIDVTGMDQKGFTAYVDIAVPLLADGAYMRKVQLDTVKGDLHVVGGVLGNGLALSAKGSIVPDPRVKFDLWGTLARNAKLLILPALIFFIL